MKKNIFILISAVLLVAGSVFADAIVEFDHSYVDREVSSIAQSYKGKLANLGFSQADAIAQEILNYAGGTFYYDELSPMNGKLVYKGINSESLMIDQVSGDILFHKGMDIYGPGDTPNLPSKSNAPALAKKHLKALGLLKQGMVLHEVNEFKQSVYNGHNNEVTTTTKMVMVTFKRKLGNYTVFGASRIIVMLGADGQLDGVLVRWTDVEKVNAKGIKKNVRGYLIDKIKTKQKDSYSILVKKSQLVLFDDGKGVIEPALFVEGDVTEGGNTFACDWMIPVLESPKAKY
jgi:hypothetical protein